MLPIGSKAPDFKLALNNGDKFQLYDFVGKRNVVLSFIPGDFENTEIDDTHANLQRLQAAQSHGAIVIIVASRKIDELSDYLTKYNFSIPVALDPTSEVCRNYRALWLRGLARRKITYVIDKKGIIRGCISHQLLAEKAWRNIMRLLKELQTEIDK